MFVTLDLRDPDRPRDAVTPATLLRLDERRKEREREESKRLLYVAMTRARDHLILAGAQGLHARSCGDWLAWVRAPLDLRDVLTSEPDVAAGGLARAISIGGGAVIRYLELLEDLDGTPIRGARGPTAGAQPPLDAPGCASLARGIAPRLPSSPAAVEASVRTLARVATPRLPPLDHGASVYTVSEVLTWATCPRQALYQYVIGDQLPFVEEQEAPLAEPVPAIPADVRGILVHELLAQWFSSSSAPTTRRAGTRLSQLLLPRVASEEVLRAGAADAVQLARAFAGSRLGRAALASSDTRCELPFLVRLDLGLPEPTLLRGTVDLLVPHAAGGWAVADYKTSDLTALEVPHRRGPHELQIQLYALGLEALGVDLRSGWVAYLVPEVLSPVELTREAREETRALLRRFIEARRELDLPPSPGSACRRCSWSGSCPASLADPNIPSGTLVDIAMSGSLREASSA